MRLKRFDALALVSTTLLVGAMGLWLSAFVLNPRDYHLSFSSTFHIGVTRGSVHTLPGRVVFFNDPDYGPYNGSIIALSDGDGHWPSNIERRWWGDKFGVYYRYFHWLDSGDTLWTLTVSLAYPVLLFAILPVTWTYRRKRMAVAEKTAIQ